MKGQHQGGKTTSERRQRRGMPAGGGSSRKGRQGGLRGRVATREGHNLGRATPGGRTTSKRRQQGAALPARGAHREGHQRGGAQARMGGSGESSQRGGCRQGGAPEGRVLEGRIVNREGRQATERLQKRRGENEEGHQPDAAPGGRNTGGNQHGRRGAPVGPATAGDADKRARGPAWSDAAAGIGRHIVSRNFHPCGLGARFIGFTVSQQ